MRKFLSLFLIFPIFVHSQQLRLVNGYTGFVFEILYPNKQSVASKVPVVFEEYYSDSNTAITTLNDSIKRLVFNSKVYDLTNNTEKLLYKKVKKEKLTQMIFRETYGQKGIISLTIQMESSKRGKMTTFYLHFDLKANTFFTLHDMLNSKNDIFSFQQSVYTTMADSIQYFEQTTLNQLLTKGTIDKETYGKIIEGLNDNLSVFRANYLSDFSITDKGIEEDFDCILPDNLLPYNHTYRVTFAYKSLKYMVKPEYLSRLTK